MKLVLVYFAILVATVLTSCLGGEDTESSAPATVQVPVAKVDFVPPSNGLLTPEKARQYADASLAILQLSQQWIDRLEKATDPQEKILILGGFDKARDQVCMKIGLSGIKEFDWIASVALQNPSNRETASKAGIQLGSK